MDEPVLAVRDLVVEFATSSGAIRAVDGLTYELRRGETLGVVGESGSGKSVSALAIMGLLRSPPARILSGEIRLAGRDLLKLDERERNRIRGSAIGMVFQDPMTSLNPLFTVGAQIEEALYAHKSSITRLAAKARCIELLELVGIASAPMVRGKYPHECSGGMRQRIMIAIAIANSPSLLIADEPTTALDVTVQAQILSVLTKVQSETQSALMLITHDLGVIAETADRVLVLYAGRAAEVADVYTLFDNPRHPYTVGLMGSLPDTERKLERLASIPGSPPTLYSLSRACAFQPRCQLSAGRELCSQEIPPLKEFGAGHAAACHYSDEVDRYRAYVAIESGGRT